VPWKQNTSLPEKDRSMVVTVLLKPSSREGMLKKELLYSEKKQLSI
jgi:hypothetical protein